MNIAGTIKYYRRRKGWAQADLHRATGYERAYISKLESGRIGDISIKTAFILCRAFGITVEEFMKTCHRLTKPSAQPTKRGRTTRKD